MSRVVVNPDGALAEVPWYEGPEYKILAEARRAFSIGGAPISEERGNRAAARRLTFWVLYEMGKALDAIIAADKRGEERTCAVRFTESGPERLVIDVTLSPAARDSGIVNRFQTGRVA